jgi:phosphate:Na+ symporter
METFTIAYTFLGGLGIFFYGMKAMSNALQQLAGDIISKVINSLTSNRILAVLVGIIVTMIVQSSSITTVMVVGFVNAGLMKLTQAIGVIFGSNIGTTITGWIISIKIGKYGLLLVGLGIFPLLFSKSEKLQSIGRVVFGVGMIFMGLELMSDAFKPLRGNPEFIKFLSYFADETYTSYLFSIMMGCVLTMIVQSSSAMLGITMALATTGSISFSTAAALVLGENIGTTITALLASVGGNVNAKRAARAHALFNLFGVFVMFCIFPFYIEFIDGLLPGAANLTLEDGSRPNIATHIAASHSIFNISATIIFLPFLNYLARLVIKITPDPKVKEKHHLMVLGDPENILPATALIQAQSENRKFQEMIGRMFTKTALYLNADTKDPLLFDKIIEYEQISDNIQKEVTLFVCAVMEKTLTSHQSKQSQALIRIADELESVADYLERIAHYRSRISSMSVLGEESKQEYAEFFTKIHEFFDLTVKGLVDVDSHDLEIVNKRSEELRLWADDMRDKHLERITRGGFDPITALTFSDMVVALRKIRAHSMNLAEAVTNL